MAERPVRPHYATIHSQCHFFGEGSDVYGPRIVVSRAHGKSLPREPVLFSVVPVRERAGQTGRLGKA